MASNELTVEQAVARLCATLRPVAGIERCALADARGRVLAQDVRAVLDVPAMANAAMDGYALRFADAAPGARLRVVGRALAGHAYAGRVGAGEAVRIMTGAAVPDGADAILMQEEARVAGNAGDAIEIVGAVTPGMHIRPRGEQLRAGDVVLARGRRLRSYDVGLAAAAGAAELTVARRLLVGVISTGDELADPPHGGAARRTQYDGNRPMLLAALRQAGHDVVDLGIVVDREDALRAALAAAGNAQVDALISSGGVAQGDADFVRRVAGEFVGLNIRPGRGLVHGRIGEGPAAFDFFGLPGNPVAAYVMYRLVVAPLLARMAGAHESTDVPLTLRLPLAEPAQARGGRVDWRRVRLVPRDGGLAVELLKLQGSAMLLTLSRADALAAVGPDASYAAGDLVDVIPLDALE